ncbi:MAG: glycosyltransferase [Nitrososphaerota archaeon]|nr:glycosyltransferase [Nitrososphaerota archaeon]
MEEVKSTPLITIGIPTSNSAWSLPEVLACILKLDYDKHRLRLVFPDNYSSDNSVEILDEFADKHESDFESIVIEKVRANIPVARNICFEKAAGSDYIFFLDSDIIVPPDTLTVLLQDFQKFNNVGMTSFPWDRANSKARARSLFDGFVTTDGPMLAYKIGNGCNLLSMNAYKKVGKFNPKLYVHEDGEYCYRLRKHGFSIICDYSHSGTHLKRVKWSARFYLRFIWNSSNTYIEMLKLGSPMHILKLTTSIILVLSIVLSIVFHQIAPLLVFAVTAVVAFWANASRRVLDDGSRVKPSYYLVIPPVLTALTVVVTGAIFVRLTERFVSRLFRGKTN